MDGLISRQAAIDALDAILPVEPMKNEYTQGITCGAALAIEYVKQLPSAQPEHLVKESGDLVKDLVNDCISRQAAIEIVDRYNKSHMILKGKPMLGAASIVIELEALPSAQPEITTCIDCIHYIPLGKDKAWGRCSVHSSPTENQRMCQSCDFCAWAERRTDG